MGGRTPVAFSPQNKPWATTKEASVLYGGAATNCGRESDRLCAVTRAIGGIVGFAICMGAWTGAVVLSLRDGQGWLAGLILAATLIGAVAWNEKR